MKSIKRLGVAVLNWILQGFVYASEGPVRYYLTKPIVFSSVEHLTAALKRAAPHCVRQGPWHGASNKVAV